MSTRRTSGIFGSLPAAPPLTLSPPQQLAWCTSLPKLLLRHRPQTDGPAGDLEADRRLARGTHSLRSSWPRTRATRSRTTIGWKDWPLCRSLLTCRSPSVTWVRDPVAAVCLRPPGPLAEHQSYDSPSPLLGGRLRRCVRGRGTGLSLGDRQAGSGLRPQSLLLKPNQGLLLFFQVPGPE